MYCILRSVIVIIWIHKVIISYDLSEELIAVTGCLGLGFGIFKGI
jgi:hypothetical protein